MSELHQETLADIEKEVSQTEAEAQAQEIDKADQEAAAELPKTSDPDKTVQVDQAAAKQSMLVLVAVVGSLACKAANVPGLTPEEVNMLTDAAHNVANQYSVIEGMDPKTAAWIGLGTAAAAVALPRIQFQGEAEAEPLPEPTPGDVEPQAMADSRPLGGDDAKT